MEAVLELLDVGGGVARVLQERDRLAVAVRAAVQQRLVVVRAGRGQVGGQHAAEHALDVRGAVAPRYGHDGRPLDLRHRRRVDRRGVEAGDRLHRAGDVVGQVYRGRGRLERAAARRLVALQIGAERLLRVIGGAGHPDRRAGPALHPQARLLEVAHHGAASRRRRAEQGSRLGGRQRRPAAALGCHLLEQSFVARLERDSDADRLRRGHGADRVRPGHERRPLSLEGDGRLVRGRGAGTAGGGERKQRQDDDETTHTLLWNGTTRSESTPQTGDAPPRERPAPHGSSASGRVRARRPASLYYPHREVD